CRGDRLRASPVRVRIDDTKGCRLNEDRNTDDRGGAGELVRETRAGAEQHPSLGDRTARESARGRGVGAATRGVRDEVAETGGGHASTPRVARPAPPAFSRLSSRPFSQERGCAWCGARYEIRVH